MFAAGRTMAGRSRFTHERALLRASAIAVAKMGDKVAGRQVNLEVSTTGKRSVTDNVPNDEEVTEVKSSNSPPS